MYLLYPKKAFYLSFLSNFVKIFRMQYKKMNKFKKIALNAMTNTFRALNAMTNTFRAIKLQESN